VATKMAVLNPSAAPAGAARRGELLGQLLVADADPLVGRFWASPLDQEADNPERAESGR
jgi:hypothetical protein